MRLNYFNFKEFGEKILVTNDFGKHLFLSRQDFKTLIQRKTDLNSEIGIKLLEANMIYDETDLEFSTRLKNDLRRVKGHLTTSTSLHIFVVTTACNMKCVYCQANNGIVSSSLYMSEEMAEKAVDIALQSPNQYLSFEFQGGEPLLNFKIIRHIVEYTERRKGSHDIQYNVVSNLTLLTDEMIGFFIKYNFGISTSLDGPETLHNSNRPFQTGEGTYKKVVESVDRLRDKGISVGAIQTTTKLSLKYPREIVRTYNNLGFESIFLRPLTPLGKATLNWNKIGYTPEEFLLFYKQALDELIEINQKERFFKEAHASIFLRRIEGKFANYMELRSPCGAGIGQIAYYADGDIFTCDEGRMLHEMGDHTFRLGNVFRNTYADLINNSVCRTVCASGILETIPGCSDCVYQPYCGTCPVVSYAKEQDIIEKGPRGYRCKIYSGILDNLFQKISENNKVVLSVLKTWSN